MGGSQASWLTDRLWVTQSRLYATNSGVFVLDGHAVLVDPGVYPSEIDNIGRFVEALDAAPKALVLTHSHWDHLLGPERFPGVPSVAQGAYLSEVSGLGAAAILHHVADWESEAGVERRRPFRIPTPDCTFQDGMTLALGDVSLELLHAPGHAADQLVVYDRDTGALWAADMLSDLEIPYVSHSAVAYGQTLAALAGLEIRVLVPGHGSPTQEAHEIGCRLDQDRVYLETLYERVLKGVNMGSSLRDVLEACGDMCFRHPSANEGPHKLNVESVFMELGGETDPKEAGWGQYLFKIEPDFQDG